MYPRALVLVLVLASTAAASAAASHTDAAAPPGDGQPSAAAKTTSLRSAETFVDALLDGAIQSSGGSGLVLMAAEQRAGVRDLLVQVVALRDAERTALLRAANAFAKASSGQ